MSRIYSVLKHLRDFVSEQDSCVKILLVLLCVSYRHNKLPALCFVPGLGINGNFSVVLFCSNP